MKNLMPPLLGAALLLAGAALPGCTGPDATTATQAPASPEAQLKLAEDSLMRQHDRLMSQDEQLIGLAAQLNAAPRPPRKLLARIAAADNAMMSWMHQQHDNGAAPDSAAPVAQRLAYLQNQQRQLAAVARQLGSVHDSAAAAVAQLPPNPNAGPAVPLPDPKK